MFNKLKKNCALLAVVLVVTILLPSCYSDKDDEAVAPESAADFEEEATEEQVPEPVLLHEGDFMPAIGGLPYKGAALFINYGGEADLSDYKLTVDIIYDGEVRQENMPVEKIDDELVAIIIDLMYLPGDELEFVINIQDGNKEVVEIYHSEKLERYPWKDWIFDLDEPISLKVPGTNYNFKYNWPGIGSGLGAHASWDFMTRFSDDVEVYSGTEGIVLLVMEYRGEGGVYIYNPYVGAIIQNGHLTKGITLQDGQNIYPGDSLANIAFSSLPHNHYSVIRPFGYTRNIGQSAAQYARRISPEFKGYYWPIWHLEGDSIFDAKYYRDPFYFHEPTTLGYWNEETLPEGLIEGMLRIFMRDNPGVVLPATESLEPLDYSLPSESAVADGSRSIAYIEPSTIVIGVPTELTLVVKDQKLVSDKGHVRVAVQLSDNEKLGAVLHNLNHHMHFSHNNQYWEAGLIQGKLADGVWQGTFVVTLPENFVEMLIQAEHEYDGHNFRVFVDLIEP